MRRPLFLNRPGSALLLLILFSAPAFTQPARFEVADVHVSPQTLDYHKRDMGGPYLTGNQMELRRAAMLNLIALAWGVEDAHVLGGPSWIAFDRFDVRAKTLPGTTRVTMQPMLQALLAERFGLAVHNGALQVPGWALTAGKNLQLKKADGSGDTGCRADGPSNQSPGSPPALIVVTCRNMTMAELANLLPEAGDYIAEGLAVVDRTGLEGAWDFSLRFASSKRVAVSSHNPTLFDAMDQLGLRLEPSTIPVNGIIVDRVNQTPTANSPGLEKAFPPDPVEFEVAVIKPSPPGDRTLNGYTAADNTKVQYLPGGRVNIQGSLQGLIRWTFGINLVRVVGLPSWANDDAWDIAAKPPTPVNDSDAISEMLHSLLASRFKMTYHFEERPISSFTLIADKPKLKKADPATRTGCVEGPAAPARSDARDENPLLSRLLTCRNISMPQFATLLFKGMASGFVGGPVFDATGLEGSWDFTLSFSAPTQLPAPVAGDGSAEPTGAISLPDAMQKQIGIRMEMQKHPVEVLVIDHLERKPTEN
jgi:uncharacterized protein (TIGR03435 family)